MILKDENPNPLAPTASREPPMLMACAGTSERLREMEAALARLVDRLEVASVGSLNFKERRELAAGPVVDPDCERSQLMQAIHDIGDRLGHLTAVIEQSTHQLQL